MLFTSSLIFAFVSLAAAIAFAAEKPQNLDFNSYVRENYQMLSRAKKPEKVRLAFQPEKERDPQAAAAGGANVPQNVDYGVDKNGNIPASGGSVWGSMNGSNYQPSTPAAAAQPSQQAAPPTPPAPPPTPPSSSGSSSSSSSGDALPQ